MKTKMPMIIASVLALLSCAVPKKDLSKQIGDQRVESLSQVASLVAKDDVKSIADYWCADVIEIKGILDQDPVLKVRNRNQKIQALRMLLLAEINYSCNGKVFTTTTKRELERMEFSNVNDEQDSSFRWQDVVFRYDQKKGKYLISGMYLDTNELVLKLHPHVAR